MRVLLERELVDTRVGHQKSIAILAICHQICQSPSWMCAIFANWLCAIRIPNRHQSSSFFGYCLCIAPCHLPAKLGSEIPSRLECPRDALGKRERSDGSPPPSRGVAAEDTISFTAEDDWFHAAKNRRCIDDVIANYDGGRSYHFVHVFSLHKRGADAFMYKGYAATTCDILLPMV